MSKSAKFEISLVHLLVPVSVLAFTVALDFAYQTTLVMKDRDALNQAMTRLEAPFAESQKLNTQFGGLVVGTQKLAEDGNSDAKTIVENLIKIGVLPNPAEQAQKAPVPAANEPAKGGPVKP